MKRTMCSLVAVMLLASLGWATAAANNGKRGEFFQDRRDQITLSYRNGLPSESFLLVLQSELVAQCGGQDGCRESTYTLNDVVRAATSARWDYTIALPAAGSYSTISQFLGLLRVRSSDDSSLPDSGASTTTEKLGCDIDAPAEDGCPQLTFTFPAARNTHNFEPNVPRYTGPSAYSGQTQQHYIPRGQCDSDGWVIMPNGDTKRC